MQPLLEAGAKAADSPRAAVADAAYAIAMVRDDAASRFVWLDENGGALAGMQRGAVAIESSTLSISWTRHLATCCAEAGAHFLDAPVSGSRPQAEAGQLIFLVGGEASVLATAEPILAPMASTVLHAGASGAGAALKLAVNTLLGIQVAGLAEVIGALIRAGIDPVRGVEVIAATPVCSPVARSAAGSMLSGEFPPMFPVELIEKDFAYALEGEPDAPTRLPLVEATRAVFASAVAKGMGSLNMTSVVRLYS
jgi:3-hydroxyisobutyrate dehydrogenase